MSGMNGSEHERVAELLSLLRPAPECAVRAAQEMPLLAAPKMSPEYAAYLKELGTRDSEITKFKELRRVEISATFRTAPQITAYLLAAQESKGKPDDEARAAGLNAAILKRWIDWPQRDAGWTTPCTCVPTGLLACRACAGTRSG